MVLPKADCSSSDSVLLNLTLNLRFAVPEIKEFANRFFNVSAQLSQGVHPENPWPGGPQTTDLDEKVKHAFNLLLNGYIGKIEQDYIIAIPSDITNLLSKYIEVGAADFYDTSDSDNMKYLVWGGISEIWVRFGSDATTKCIKF